jgi:hypothetical protein
MARPAVINAQKCKSGFTLRNKIKSIFPFRDLIDRLSSALRCGKRGQMAEEGQQNSFTKPSDSLQNENMISTK